MADARRAGGRARPAAAEHERTAAEARADLEERTRLALWRMDALGAAVMLRENRVAADSYQNLDPIGGDPAVLLHFEICEGGVTTSPEWVAGGAKVSGPLAERLQRLRAVLAANPLPGDEWSQLTGAILQGENVWKAMPRESSKEEGYNTRQRLNKTNEEIRQDENYQTNSNLSERAQRAKAVGQTMDYANGPAMQQRAEVEADSHAAPATPATSAVPADKLREQGAMAEDRRLVAVAPAAVDVGQMRGVWLGGELFLLRQVVWNLPSRRPGQQVKAAAAGKKTAVQGVWLDSQVLREQLLRGVADLLPQARLLAALGEHAADDPLAMVSFPFRLERNEFPTPAPAPARPAFGAPLGVAWAAVTLAVLTSSLLVRGVMRLSERRASFVSAVTHELRTPLTTFRLYSDMLESGAVKEEKRGHYLRVLAREADRLSHLVENVLAFSRIERGTARANPQEIAAGELLERSRERLDARLATAGLALDMDTACALRVRVDTAAVDHILFNLIDNAAKYAVRSNPPVVTIRVQCAGRAVDIFVSDHGPGIPPVERARIFRAFHKSAREAAESQPGVGLGLALSRRLAKAQGGDLTCGGPGAGACFILRLPAA